MSAGRSIGLVVWLHKRHPLVCNNVALHRSCSHMLTPKHSPSPQQTHTRTSTLSHTHTQLHVTQHKQAVAPGSGCQTQRPLLPLQGQTHQTRHSACPSRQPALSRRHVHSTASTHHWRDRLLKERREATAMTASPRQVPEVGFAQLSLTACCCSAAQWHLTKLQSHEPPNQAQDAPLGPESKCSLTPPWYGNLGSVSLCPQPGTTAQGPYSRCMGETPGWHRACKTTCHACTAAATRIVDSVGASLWVGPPGMLRLESRSGRGQGRPACWGQQCSTLYCLTGQQCLSSRFGPESIQLPALVALSVSRGRCMRLHRSTSLGGLVGQHILPAGGVHLCSAQGVASGLPRSPLLCCPTAIGWCARPLASNPQHMMQHLAP